MVECGPRALGSQGSHRRPDPSTPVRSGAQVGLGHPRRRTSNRVVDALRERDRVLRPYSPGTPPDDRAYRAPFREVLDVSAAGTRIAAQPHAVAVGRQGTI